ncbi:hypothetical protein OsI_00129 [Oryza sativa Indica Group]|uniref:Wall-associated receptor kinase galacturonan-binding domain-containing protein n=1 Tax=Oryza sativa subsp. indica TaxID=39946 RepID=B8ACU4_ORYSI|nr:hypothetical protein OsI_00129 [Oryza sativa Indica Group]
MAASVVIATIISSAEVGGGRRHHRRHDCPPFTCGHLSDVSFPFRWRGDPPECGVQSYELTCADDKATIQIDKETYSEIRNSSWMYMPVACLSTSRSFVYVFIGQQSAYIQNLEPSCGYLATTPLGGSKLNSTSALQNVSYQDVVKLMMTGFAVRFPFTVNPTGTGSKERIANIAIIDFYFWSCFLLGDRSHNNLIYMYMVVDTVPIALLILKWTADNSSQAYYPSWVYDRLIEQQVGAGEISAATVANMHELERKLCIIGLHCIQMKSHDRPTMSEVIEMLDGGVVGLQMPPRPFFCDDESMSAMMDSYQFSSGLTEILEEDE